MTLFTGTIPTFAAGDTTTVPTNLNLVRDAEKALTEAWTSYTPTWTGSTTNPVIGNGAIVGGWAQAGKMIDFRILVTVGTTTTFGSGVLSLSLPIAPRASVGIWTWKGVAIDAGVAQYEWNLQWSSGTACQMLYPNTGSNQLGTLSGTAPFTLGSTDTLSVQGRYESV